MQQSVWDEIIVLLQRLVMKPIGFKDLKITLIDTVNACHEIGWRVEEHRHPWFEFNYVSHGCLHTTIEGTEFAAGQGTFFLIPPGVFHSNHNQGEFRDDGFCLRWQIESANFPESGLDEERVFNNVMETLSHIRPFSESRELIDSFISDIGNSSGLLSLQVAFAGLIVKLFEHWNEESVGQKNKSSRAEIIVRQALLYLSEYSSSHISVNDLASSLNISYRHLARIFKNITGVTIIEKLNELRVNHAKRLLIDSDKSIREIALTVGFENEYYFSNTFSQYVYSAPTEFRKNLNR